MLTMIALFLLARFPLSGWWVWSPLPLIFGLGVWLDRLERRLAELSRAIAFYERAMARIEGRWAGTGPSGARFLDEAHIYARDLDLFGEGSLFDLLSNARTTMGEEALAGWLLEPAAPAVVRSRQQAVQELSSRLDLHERLAGLAEDVRQGVNPTSLSIWSAESGRLNVAALQTPTWVLSVLGLAAIVAIVLILMALAETIVLSQSTHTALRAFALPVVLTVSVFQWRVRREVEHVLGSAESAGAHLALLGRILLVLETERFSSPLLSTLQARLATDGHPPSQQIARLRRLVNIAESRRNWFAKLFGPLLLFELNVALRLETWRRIVGPAVPRWLGTVGDVEALASLGSYAHGRPDHTFPELVETPRYFDATALGHPLLENPVTNDVAIRPPLQTLIVSGSNMSGKSTFLRTIGLNVVLAQSGGPVFAARMRLSALTVAASIRILDSLREGRSRFYAEILRLKQIIDIARDGHALFLIDEFLHGTNSHDRLIGATGLVEALVKAGAIGLITTHDLALTKIADSLGDKAANVHFLDEVQDGQMHYDYRLRPGVVSRSNAIALMRSIGLDV